MAPWLVRNEYALLALLLAVLEALSLKVATTVVITKHLVFVKTPTDR